MATKLFDSTIFGPIHSRRLGVSLGINLLPTDGKICSFDCIYCECGYNAQGQGSNSIPARATVKKMLRKKLKAMLEAGETLDVITFAGNGEPTVHPHFAEIVADTIAVRNEFYPNAKVSVLTNSSFLGNPKVVKALKSVDNNLLKLDSAVARTMRVLNAPVNKEIIPEGVIIDIKQFNGDCTIQTMILRGTHNGVVVDNTTDIEIDALIGAYREIAPKEIMIYSIDRETPEKELEKVSIDELEKIATKIREAGFNVKVN
ncbi:MAG: radical SAM protein [Bacteroidales bacterium]